jgi:hypothetical protein
MSITNVLAQLEAILAGVNPAPQPSPARVDGPSPSAAEADFPLIKCVLAANAENTIVQSADVEMTHRYKVRIYIMLCGMAKEMSERYALVEPWPRAVAITLYAHLTLNGSCQIIGDQESGELFSWKIGPIQWGGPDDQYWGPVIDLWVNEKEGVTINA